MNRANTTLIVLCLLLLAASGWLLYERADRSAEVQAAPSTRAQEEEAHEGPGLVAYMSSMQRYSHKLMLAVRARDAQAAGFYLHELEELSETVEEEVPTYEGYEIGALVDRKLVPALTELDAALDAGQWQQIDVRIERLTTACNQCHGATDHGFIQITHENLTNPYNQAFGTAAQ